MFRLYNSHLRANIEQCWVHKVWTQWDRISFTGVSYTVIGQDVLCNTRGWLLSKRSNTPTNINVMAQNNELY
jgi:hypothetical protein